MHLNCARLILGITKPCTDHAPSPLVTVVSDSVI